MQGMVVCDLGCGTGLTSLAALQLGAERVLALDLNTDSLALTRESAARSFGDKPAAARLETMAFDMMGSDALAARTGKRVDLLVLSDLLYYEDMARAAAGRALEVMLAGGEVLVTDPGRNTQAAFLAELKSLAAGQGSLGESPPAWTPPTEEVAVSFRAWIASLRFERFAYRPAVGQAEETGYFLWL
jgi:predicted nicotinamide N-methyase